MNLKSLEYFVEVAKDLNMTTAAQRLCITQQALSLQIRHLEQEYGVELFYRQPKLRLTYAGELLKQTANEILSRNDELVNVFSGISQMHSGHLRVGISTLRAQECFPLILPSYRERWPNVRLDLVEASSEEMIRLLLDRKLDLVVSPLFDRYNLSTLKEHLDTFFLINEQNYVVCSDPVLDRVFGTRADQIKKQAIHGTDLKAFAEMPFVLGRRPMRTRMFADECFRIAGIRPHIVMEMNQMDFIPALYDSHIGAFVCQGIRLASVKKSCPDCHAFPIKMDGVHATTPVYLMYSKAQQQPKHLIDFANSLKEAWRQIKRL